MNQDISILFKDLKSVEISPLIDGWVGGWMGGLMDGWVNGCGNVK